MRLTSVPNTTTGPKTVHASETTWCDTPPQDHQPNARDFSSESTATQTELHAVEAQVSRSALLSDSPVELTRHHHHPLGDQACSLAHRACRGQQPFHPG